MLTKQKTDRAGWHAERAWSENKTAFIYRQAVNGVALGASGPLTVVAEIIEEVEAVGWIHRAMVFESSRNNKLGAVLLLFRRA